jgi:hypothetical protein
MASRQDFQLAITGVKLRQEKQAKPPPAQPVYLTMRDLRRVGCGDAHIEQQASGDLRLVFNREATNMVAAVTSAVGQVQSIRNLRVSSVVLPVSSGSGLPALETALKNAGLDISVQSDGVTLEPPGSEYSFPSPYRLVWRDAGGKVLGAEPVGSREDAGRIAPSYINLAQQFPERVVVTVESFGNPQGQLALVEGRTDDNGRWSVVDYYERTPRGCNHVRRSEATAIASFPQRRSGTEPKSVS